VVVLKDVETFAAEGDSVAGTNAMVAEVVGVI